MAVDEIAVGRTRILVGDAREVLPRLEPESIQCCVTSPPYWGLRDYGHPSQLGAEDSHDKYVANLVEIFREVRRVLRPDGTLWLNVGDGYARNGGSGRLRPQRQGRQHEKTDPEAELPGAGMLGVDGSTGPGSAWL